MDQKEIKTEYLPIERELKFGGVRFLIPLVDLFALGFELGDSVDIAFSDGRVLQGIPLLNGYYVNRGEYLISAYPNFTYPCLFRNNEPDIWYMLDMSESMTAQLSLAKKGAFLQLQKDFNQHHSNDRKDFASDEIFANYRDIAVGDMKPDRLYRSASACNNLFLRTATVNRLMQRDQISAVLDLADAQQDLDQYRILFPGVFPYFEQLYARGDVLLLPTNNSLEKEAFQKSLKHGLRFLLDRRLPWLFFCSEGKDRTGIYAFILGALCGAGLSELEADYMQTYDNYYHISKEKTPELYDRIKHHYFDAICDAFAQSVGLHSGDDLNNESLQGCAKAYLLYAGLSREEIKRLQNRLTR